MILKVEIDTRDLVDALNKSGDFINSPEIESSLVELMNIQKTVDEAISQAKEAIYEAGTEKFGDSFKSIRGNKIKFTVAKSGAKYSIKDEDEAVAASWATEEKKFKINTKVVDKAIENGEDVSKALIINDRKDSKTLKML